MHEQLSLPIIIVARGQSSSSTGRSKIATQLASYTKLPLIDQDDVAKALEGSFSSSSIQPRPASQNDLSNLCFKVLLQVASAQLRSNLGVIINSALSNQTHVDQLKQLVNSHGAELILIQCRPPDEIDDYDVGGAGRKLMVDTAEPFHVEEFVSKHLGIRPSLHQAVALQPKSEKPNTPKGNLLKTPSLIPPRKVTERIHRHLHALTLLNKQKNEDGVLCKCCKKPISVPYYPCLDCDEYIFHKFCAEEPRNLDLVRQECPEYLRAREPKEYPFSVKQSCSRCVEKKGLSRDCHDRLFQTSMKGKFLPIVVNHESHAHPLNLMIMPISLNYEYGCCGCGEFGKSISYRCYDCNINFHVGSVLLSRTVSSEHDRHTLRLTYDALDHNYWEQSYSKVCKEKRNPELWFYSCQIRDIVIHIGCVTVTD